MRIHGLKDKDGRTDSAGPNPFDFLGYGTSNTHPGKMVPNAKYKDGWKIYEEADPISSNAAAYLQTGTKPILSTLFSVYDWVADYGYQNFGAWAQSAARQAGR